MRFCVSALLLLLHCAVVTASSDKPVLAVGSFTGTLTASTASSLAKSEAALQRLKLSTRAVSDAARAADSAIRAAEAARRLEEAAKEQLRSARQEVTEARRDLEHQEKSAERERDSKYGKLMARYEKRLRAERWRTLALLFGFTFLNGLARRSLSSSGPSFVENGLMTEKSADAIFMVGFEAFAVGKFLVVPMTLLLGLRRSILTQIAISILSLAATLVTPESKAVQLGGWVIFRIASAMAVSTMLPFVGAWYPRRIYGRVFALLFSGFQFGYLFASYYWQRLLFAGRLHWRIPLTQCVAGFALLLGACFFWLWELPPSPPNEEERKKLDRFRGSGRDQRGKDEADSALLADHSAAPKVQLGKLLHKVATRWVFWAMLAAAAAYTPAVEYSTHVTSYLKEMFSDHGPAKGAFVCMQSTLCEGRYRGYVASYLSALLVGSVLYDRATQLDRAFLVLALLVINVSCWLALALAEPDAPAAAWIKAVVQDPTVGSLVSSFVPSFLSSTPEAGGEAQPLLKLSGPTKTALASIAGATIALPSSLPFALFSLDFGKEGAAVLSGLISVVGSFSALTFLKNFPAILRARGWFGVHACLAFMSSLAAIAMGAVMFSDSKKFSKGYIIRSSLLDQTVVALHACSRPSCSHNPMWRPGQRRTWGPNAGMQFKPHAPSSVCQHCGRGDLLVECSVDEAAAAAALLTPFDRCGEWIRAEKPLRKPKQGWEFANDPTKHPLAMDVIDMIDQ